MLGTRSIAESRRLALVVTSHLSVNGLLLPTLPSLIDAGWQIHIICAPGPIDAEVRKLATVEFVSMKRSVSPGRDGIATARMAHLLHKIQPDVLVGGTPKAAMISMLAGRLARVPVRVFHVWGARWDGLDGRLRRVLLAADRVTAFNATDVLSVSNSLADLMVSSGSCTDRPLVLESGGSKGVDTAIFRPRAESDFDPAAPHLGFVGRLAVDKGIDEALAVFGEIQQASPLVSMTVIGEMDESQPVSTKTIESVTNEPAITWVRKLSPKEVADAMCEMDLLLFPSIREGLPNAVIEAAACGVPTVGWNATGVRDAVVPGVTGYLVPVGDQSALVAVTKKALAPERHRRLREGAIRFASTEFASEKVQAAFVEYLECLLVKSQR